MKKILKKLLKVLKITGITLLSAIILFFVIYLFLPKGPRDLMSFTDPYHTSRPAVKSSQYMAATGTPWATKAALDVMDNGGNAYDAAVAALLTLNVTYGEAASFPCVAPILAYDSESGNVIGYNGVGTAPSGATIDFFHSKGYKNIPKYNILGQLIPGSVDAAIALLTDRGTKSFTELCTPAIKIARDGFPIHYAMMNNFKLNLIERIGLGALMPYNLKVYFNGEWWRPMNHGDRFTRPELADTLQSLCDAEQKVLTNGGTREEGLKAVRDYFYKGPIADTIANFHAKNGGLITKEDLANYSGYWEQPLSGKFGEYTIFSNNTWCQGAVVPMTLQILDGIDLKSMGHNSPEYIHTVLQAIELTMADREAYFGDPAFVNVPIEGLLNPAYAADRRNAMTPGKAFGKMPQAGDPFKFQQDAIGIVPGMTMEVSMVNPTDKKSVAYGKDTSYISIIDKDGNAVSLTPSDFPESPMVPRTGMTLGTRMIQFYLDENSPDSLQPGKRPRITPNPSMVFKDGKFYMSFGTPGGDVQTQAMVQVFLNMTVFGMDPQEAIEAPRFRSLNWPDSFAPHQYSPGTIELEKSIYDSCGKALEQMGYKVMETIDWDNVMGAACAIVRDQTTGELTGGADPREESWAEGK